MTRLTQLLFLGPWIASSLAAQGRSVPTIRLGPGVKEFAEPFSQIVMTQSGMVMVREGSVREMRDGRVLVSDFKEKTLLLADFATGGTTPVGRQGGGPLEYQMGGMFIGNSADTVLLMDVMQQRLLVIGPGAKPVRVEPLGTGNFNFGDEKAVNAMMSRMQPSAADAQGRVFGVSMGMTMPTNTKSAEEAIPKFADSVDLQMLDLRTKKATTVARVRSVMGLNQPKVEMSGASAKLTLTAPDFRGSDMWAVLPDGRVAMLRKSEYRVQFFSAGKPVVSGPIVSYTPVPVTAAEKRGVVDSLKNAMSKLMNMGVELAAEGGRGAAEPKVDFNVLEPATWPANKSPYLSIQSFGDSRLLVKLSTPRGAKDQPYDLLDANGALLAHIVLPMTEPVVGLGKGTIYTIRRDADDLQYLRRHTVPKVP